MIRRWLSVSLLIILAAVTGCAAGQSGTTQSAQTPGGSVQPAGPAQPKSGGILKYGLPRDAISLDPHVTQGSTSGSVQGNVYDTLIEYDEKGTFRGALAERWEIPNNTTYLFYLRKGVKFHNGQDLTAADVLASLNRMKDPNTKATRKAMVDAMASFEAVDSHTVRMVLKAADATFLHALASDTAVIVSAADVGKLDYAAKTNGTGPFILESWEPQTRYTFKKNPNYWKPGLPYLDGMVYTPIQDDKARMNALRSGVVDAVGTVPWQEAADLAKDHDVYHHQSLFNMVRLNTAKPPLDNKLVRQALNYIIDREAVMGLAFGGQGRLMDGTLQPFGSQHFHSDRVGHFKKDHARALALLKQAGFNSPADVPALEFTVANIGVHSETAQVVQNQLKEFGIKIVWKSVEVPVMNANRLSGTYVMQQDGLSMSWPDPDYLRPLFHSKGNAHAVGAKFKNERLDQLLEAGAKSVDEAERKRLYREAEEIILDEAPWIFLFWRPTAEASAKKVKGYAVLPGGLGAFNVNRFEYLWLSE